MTNSPDPEQQPRPNFSRRLRLLLWSRTGIAIGVPLLVGIVGGGWWLWIFIHQQLSPLVERNLSQTLNRPVQLGQLENFSLTGLRFGPTSVPATPTDPDRVSIAAVDVTIQPLALLLARTLLLDVTLIDPKLYIQQNQQQQWVSTTIAAGEGEGPIKTALDTIYLRNADIVLVSSVNDTTKPLPQNTVSLTQVDAAAEILEDGQLIKFNLNGQPQRGGKIDLSGDYRPSTTQASLQVQTQDFLASDLTRLIELPLDLQGGRVDSDLQVQLTTDQTETLIYGTANLKSVTALANQLPRQFIDSRGKLEFNGTQIRLNNVASNYGKIPAIANGTLDTEAGFDLAAKVKAVSAAAALETLNLQLPVPAAGTFGAEIKLTGPITEPVLTGAAANTQPARLDRVSFSKVSTNFALSTAEGELTFSDALAIPTAGGKITGKGTVQLGQQPGQVPGIAFNAVAQDVPGDAIAKLYGAATPDITIGPVSAQARVSGTAETPLTVIDWQATRGTYPGTGQLAIANQNLTLRDTSFQVGGGTVEAAGQLTLGDRWQAAVEATGVQLGRLAQVPPTLQTPVNGRFEFSGSAASFQPEAISATGSGRLTGIAGGTLVAENIRVAAGRWQTQLQAQGLELGQLAQVPPNLQTGSLAGTFNLSGRTTAFTPETLNLKGQGSLNNLAGGTITAPDIQLAAGQWQTLINASGVQLSQFSPQLRGQLGGQLRLTGTVDTFSPAGIRANGQLGLSEGLIGEPLQALFRWDGERVIVQQATSASLQASGAIATNARTAATPTITGLDFDLRLQNYDLQNVPVQLPGATVIAGLANFDGKVTGTLPTPNVVGSVRLQNLAVNDLAFDPVLAGNVQLEAERGFDLQLAGQQDQIALNLDSNYRPTSFLVRLADAVATGQTVGDDLAVNVANFPLRVLRLAPPNPAFGPGNVAGTLSADLTVNLDTFATTGNLAIANPGVGRIQGDRLAAEFQYTEDGSATLTSSEFIKGESRYALSGSVSQITPGQLPQFQGQAQITQGRVQDILAALQFFEFQDLGRGLQPPAYGQAQDVQTLPVGLPSASLLTQLRRLTEVEVLLQRQRQQQQDTRQFPALANLTGTFGGEISASGSPAAGISADFDLEGQDWQLDDYVVNRIVVQGNFADEVVTLLPLRVESGQSLLAFTGQVGGPQQSGQLRVRDFPIELVKQFVELPVDFTGNLSASATLAGSRANPQAIGELQLADGTLNQKPLEAATASFSYNNSRLNFGSNIVVVGPEPIEITGSIPYQLPMAAVPPDNDEIRLDVNVEDEGLALLNLFTDQVAWEGGQGRVQLEVRGSLDQPVASGIATVQDATITGQALPAPLTDVTGKVLFANDRIIVDDVQGNFSQGRVVARGVIPIFAGLPPQDPDFVTPLNIALNQLDLNLQGLYQGDVNGNVIIAGAALNPLIGGEIRLNQGEVSIPEAAGTTPAGSPPLEGDSATPATPDDTAAPKQLAPGGTGESQFEFNDLRIVLGDRIEVTRQPILNVQATGALTINGSLNDLRPEGTIRLRRGGVNLFTTQFLIDRDYEQTATFRPQDGTDPTLNLLLFARVPEVTQNPLPVATSSSEINEPLSTDFGALQTIRVEARVEGPASELFENLELTSTPSRSQSEIVSLIGGGFLQTLGRGDSALGLANIAGSALLSTYQGTITDIGNNLGLSELRIFPTTITDEESQRASTLSLAAEASVDISRRFAVSALAFLTAEQAAQFGFSYRLDDSMRVRASTDFSGESRAVLEYQNRF